MGWINVLERKHSVTNLSTKKQTNIQIKLEYIRQTMSEQIKQTKKTCI